MPKGRVFQKEGTASAKAQGRSVLSKLKEEQRGWHGQSHLSKERSARGPESASDVGEG